MTNDLLREWLSMFPPNTVTVFDSEYPGEVSNIFYLPSGGLEHHPANGAAVLLLNPEGLVSSRYKLLRDEHGRPVIHDDSLVVVDCEISETEHHQYLPQDEHVFAAYMAYLWFFEAFGSLPTFMSAWGPYRVSISDPPVLKFFEYNGINATHSIDLPI